MSAAPPALLLGAAVLAHGLPSERLVRVRVALGGPDAPGPRRGADQVLAAAGLAALGLLLLGPVGAVLLPVAVGGGRRWRRAAVEAGARVAEQRRAVEAVRALGAALRAGRTGAEALEVAADVATGTTVAALDAAAVAARCGDDVAAALCDSSGSARELLVAVATCWRVCAHSGSGLAPALDRVVEAERAARDQRRALDVALAGPRATAALLAGLPIAGIGLAALLGARPLDVLLRTPVGAGCLALGIALDVLGLLWTRRIARGPAG